MLRLRSFAFINQFGKNLLYVVAAIGPRPSANPPHPAHRRRMLFFPREWRSFPLPIPITALLRLGGRSRDVQSAPKALVQIPRAAQS